MSHIARIEIEIKDLSVLQKACDRLGLDFRENQSTYQWYGRWIGDGGPLPQGISLDDLGKCDHAINVPNCKYELGVVKRGKKYLLLWDSWKSGGLTKALGQDAGVLKQAYAVERVKKEARLKGMRLSETKKDQVIRLTLTH